jgi:predicted DNA-binding transcriptional regulator YafY
MAYKHDYDKILTRLTVILSKLNDGEALSVKELAKEFNISDRTIQRDFNERLASFPIYQENKKWKMQDGFRVEKTKSLEDEIVLDIIEKITEGIGGKFSTKAHKLLSKIKNEDFNPIYTKLNIEDISDRFEDIQVIETAIRGKKELKCSYNDERHDIYTTTIQPLKIVNFEGFWYLIALQKDILKKYYLKNVSNPKILESTFKSDEELEELLDNSLSVWFQRDIEPFEVKLYADKSATKYFKRRPLPTQQIDSLHNDGTMEFSVSITCISSNLSLISSMLSFV